MAVEDSCGGPEPRCARGRMSADRSSRSEAGQHQVARPASSKSLDYFGIAKISPTRSVRRNQRADDARGADAGKESQSAPRPT